MCKMKELERACIKANGILETLQTLTQGFKIDAGLTIVDVRGIRASLTGICSLIEGFQGSKVRTRRSKGVLIEGTEPPTVVSPQVPKAQPKPSGVKQKLSDNLPKAGKKKKVAENPDGVLAGQEKSPIAATKAKVEVEANGKALFD